MNHLTTSSSAEPRKENKDLWRTPNTSEQPIIDTVARVFGGAIGLDPTSDKDKSVPAKAHITQDEDCLVIPWAATSVFMNPPFSNPLPFVQRLCYFFSTEDISEAIGLFRLGVISNQGTGALIADTASAYCVWGGGKARRIAFLNAYGVPVHGADFDCCLIYWGDEPKNFADKFQKFGTILCPYF